MLKYIFCLILLLTTLMLKGQPNRLKYFQNEKTDIDPMVI